MTKVVNLRIEPYDLYAGRGSIWGNPFQIGVDGDRETVILRYKEWFSFLVKDERIQNELKGMKDKRLGCFCKQPGKNVPCHADIIAEYIDKNY
jgi:hypothetical protein